MSFQSQQHSGSWRICMWDDACLCCLREQGCCTMSRKRRSWPISTVGTAFLVAVAVCVIAAVLYQSLLWRVVADGVAVLLGAFLP